MGIWGVVVILVFVLLVVGLLAAVRGKEGRIARQRLRQLRHAERRTVNASEVVARRREMARGQTPGSDAAIGGL